MTYVSAATNTRPVQDPRPKTLPHVVTKSGHTLHVYARASDVTPIATYDRQGSWWVRRGSDDRVKSQSEAIKSVIASDLHRIGR